jgi:hypothetical protein
MLSPFSLLNTNLCRSQDSFFNRVSIDPRKDYWLTMYGDRSQASR